MATITTARPQAPIPTLDPFKGYRVYAPNREFKAGSVATFDFLNGMTTVYPVDDCTCPAVGAFNDAGLPRPKGKENMKRHIEDCHVKARIHQLEFFANNRYRVVFDENIKERPADLDELDAED